MIQITEMAAEKIKGIMSQQNLPDEGGLRIYANSGCCSNSSYGMSLEKQHHPEDNVFDSQGVRVMIDPASFAQLEGASVEYYKDDQAEGFTIQKPKAASSCGCGNSGGCGCGGNCNC